MVVHKKMIPTEDNSLKQKNKNKAIQKCSYNYN